MNAQPIASSIPEYFDPEGSRTSPRTWVVFIVLAIVTLELTANSSLALAVGCVKFGSSDFRRAHRIRRQDSFKVRGRVCARFTLAWGLWKTSMVASFLMFMIANLEMRQGVKPPGAQDVSAAFMTACLLAMLGLGLSALASTFAVASALRNHLKVWIGKRENRAKTVLLSAILVWVSIGILIAAVFGMALIPHLDSLPPIALIVIAILPMVATPFSILTLVEALEYRVAAKVPSECWGIPPAEPFVPSRPVDSWDDDARDWRFDPSSDG